MKYGLTEATVNRIRCVFACFPAIDKAILYGSRAKGTFKTGSDIDLTLYGEGLTLQLCSAIADVLDDLLLPYTIDLSIFDKLAHAELRESIGRSGVVFYDRAHGADLGYTMAGPGGSSPWRGPGADPLVEFSAQYCKGSI